MRVDWIRKDFLCLMKSNFFALLITHNWGFPGRKFCIAVTEFRLFVRIVSFLRCIVHANPITRRFDAYELRLNSFVTFMFTLFDALKVCRSSTVHVPQPDTKNRPKSFETFLGCRTPFSLVILEMVLKRLLAEVILLLQSSK